MSNAVERDVSKLVEKELTVANIKFPPFHSAHEGYAVILEEVDELLESVHYTTDRLNCLWMAVKSNDMPATDREIDWLEKTAINAACEAIQVAAMCRKFRTMRRS